MCEDVVINWLNEVSKVSEIPKLYENKSVSNSCVVGNNLDHVIKKDVLIKEGNDDELRTNYASGCTSILNLSKTASGFNPFENDVSTFNAYMKKVISSPFFSLDKYETVAHHRNETEWNSLIEAVCDLYEGIETHQINEIKHALIKLAKSAASRKDVRNTQTLFIQSVIKVNTNATTVYIYSSTIALMESSMKGIDSKQVDIEIKQVELTFNERLWYQYAHVINKNIIKLVTDWIQENTIQEDLGIRLCIDGLLTTSNSCLSLGS